MTNPSEARNEIRGLIFAYTDALDSGDLDEVTALFEHATIRVDGINDTAYGKDQVRAFFAAVTFYHNGNKAEQDHTHSTPATQHLTSNVHVEIGADGITATARSRFTVFQACPGLALQAIIAGRYRDSFELHDGRWRFSERVEYIDLVGDLSHHLNEDFRQKTTLGENSQSQIRDMS
ncbi:nuclear transport factor 2 family protein [Parahaliea sp. F7430]|uniref:Nuclear transport factor 2 family protein n=1 Tax=Sediminihaliea albiluteola TaxID=2758564 RepID=A0A7W2YIN7_9GAMM|nr:nuclear transport factor 2 family protein [Sediminihaliea albiluteola]MBA6412310.1 nuclear transport factor 2 family protein [Sediminihaliea albiluteola]